MHIFLKLCHFIYLLINTFLHLNFLFKSIKIRASLSVLEKLLTQTIILHVWYIMVSRLCNIKVLWNVVAAYFVHTLIVAASLSMVVVVVKALLVILFHCTEQLSIFISRWESIIWTSITATFKIMSIIFLYLFINLSVEI